MPTPLSRLHAIALPMSRDNIDTDELIPVFENTRTVQDRGWGDGLFAGQRYLDGVGHTPNPVFILNQAPFDRARIVVAGANFGCGSSRESAAWALRDYGVRVVLAASFNETFKRNAVGNGLAPLIVRPHDLQSLQAAIREDPQRGLTIDLPAGSIQVGVTGPTFSFALDPYECALLTTGRTEDDMLDEVQQSVDARRDALLEQAPWLRSVAAA
jgi:3-isopropylmalate/(R)-2-methylmalate dehydratase small subunit